MANTNRAPYEGGTYLTSGQLWSGSETTVLKSFLGAKNEADKARRNEAERRVAVLRDDWMGYLKARIFESFQYENATELLKVADISNNPAKRIVAALSNLYTKPPVWTFADNVDPEPWSQVLRQVRASVVMPELNRLTTACNESLLYITPSVHGLRWHAVAPHDVVAWQDPDDPAVPIAVGVFQAMANTPGATPCWHMWSRDPKGPYYRKLDVKGRVLMELVGDAYPYRDETRAPVLPAVLYHNRYPTVDLWDTTSGDDIFEATVLIAFLETWLNHLFRTDAVAQKYITGKLDARSDQVGGPNNFLLLRSADGTPVTVGQFASQANYDALGNQILRKINNVLNNYGLSMDDIQVTGDPASGFALRVRKEGLMEQREAVIPVYTEWDRQTYAATAAVWNFERLNDANGVEGPPLPWPDEAQPQITYAPFQTVLTVQEEREKLAVARERMELGLSSPVGLYLETNPGASEEEAEEAVRTNKGLTKDLIGFVSEMDPRGGPFDPEASASEEPPEEGEAKTLPDEVMTDNSVDPNTALNGAQVTSMVSTIQAVAEGALPRPTGIEILVAAFPIDRAQAESIMGEVGKTFVAAPPPAKGAPAQQAADPVVENKKDEEPTLLDVLADRSRKRRKKKKDE